MLLGVALGLLAGWRGGWLDGFIMRVADVQLSFPSILMALLIFGVARGFIPPTEREAAAMWVLILAIGLSDWVQYARTVRAIVAMEKRKEYVLAARAIGCGPWRIVLVHILPNTMSSVLVIATMGLALAIIAEATLSFLGVGVPPTQPSLGTLIRIGQGFLFSGEWWILLFPACTLLVLALAVNLLGDWLRDALEPAAQVSGGPPQRCSVTMGSVREPVRQHEHEDGEPDAEGEAEDCRPDAVIGTDIAVFFVVNPLENLFGQEPLSAIGSQSAICGKNITSSMPMICSTMNGSTETKISCSVMSFGATDLSQKQAGPNGGDRK